MDTQSLEFESNSYSLGNREDRRGDVSYLEVEAAYFQFCYSHRLGFAF